MKVSAAYASEHFDELLSATDNGEEVEVSRDGKPSVKLLVMPMSTEQISRTRIFGAGRGEIILGAGRGEVTLPTDEEWRAMDEEIAREMNNAPLMTTGEV